MEKNVSSKYKQYLCTIISSFDLNFPVDLILLMIDYYGVIGKWVNMGVSKTCKMTAESNNVGCAYNSLRDEYWTKNNYEGISAKAYQLDEDGATITCTTSAVYHSDHLGCFDNDGN